MIKALIPLLLALAALTPDGPSYADVANSDSFEFRPAHFDQAALSPDGEYIAVTTIIPGQPRAHNLVTMRLSDGLAKALTGFSDRDVASFFWANDQRLIFSTEMVSDVESSVRQYRDSYTIIRDGAGGRKVQSVRRHAAGSSGAGMPPLLLHRLPTDWNNVLISSTSPVSGLPEVYLLNVETGRSKRVATNEFHITRWFADNAGNVRAAIDKGANGLEQLLYRDTPKSPWRQLVANKLGDLTVLAFHADNQRLIVLAQPGQDDAVRRRALYLMNSDGKLVEMLLSDAAYDIGNLSGGASGLKQTGGGHTVYYQYMADRIRTVYFDPRWQTRQEIIDAALADTVNTIIDWSDDERKLLVLARVDPKTSDYYIFDTTRQELKYLQPPAQWLASGH